MEGPDRDAYKSFRFRVKWDGRYIAGASEMSALHRTAEVVRHREGGGAASGRKECQPITLERGVTHDAEFEEWARVGAPDARKDLVLDVFNEAGHLVISYKVFRCWVSEYQALPDLDAGANAVAIEHLKLENESWLRDVDVAEPGSDR